MTIYLHIGLHKTSTTFLQNYIFPQLSENIDYNPRELIEPLKKNIFYVHGDVSDLVIEKMRLLIKKYDVKSDLLLSCEAFSQFPFCFNFSRNSSILSKLFPGAVIILFLRFQTDWLLSAYRESVHQGAYQSINIFLNYRCGGFQKAVPGYCISNASYSVNVWDADYNNLLSSLHSNFGKENVHVFFYEHFRKNPKKIILDLGGLLKNESLIDLNRPKVNVGYSALAIQISIFLYKFFSAVGLKNLMSTEKSNFQHGSAMRWSEAKLKLSPVSLCWDFIKRVFRRIKGFTWRKFIQCYFDRLFYFDWDLLAKNKLRCKLDIIFHKKNRELLRYLTEEEIPSNYL